MNLIDKKINELLSQSKLYLKEKRIEEAIKVIEQVLQLDSENEEANYVIKKLLQINKNIKSSNSKIIIASQNNRNKKSKITVLFNEIEVGSVDENTTFLEMPIKNDGLIGIVVDNIRKNVEVKKNDSLIINIDSLFSEKNKVKLINTNDYKESSKFIKSKLEEESYDLVQTVLNQVLLFNYDVSELYLYLLLVENKKPSINKLIEDEVIIWESEYYNEALRYANENEKEHLLSIEENIKNKIYQESLQMYNSDELVNATRHLMKISGYLDVDKLITKYEKEIEDRKKESIYLEAISFLEDNKYKQSLEKFNNIKTYKDSSEFIDKIKQIEENIKLYNESIVVFEGKTNNELLILLKKSIKTLEKIEKFKDSQKLIKKYTNKVVEIEEQIKKEKELKEKKRKKAIIIFTPILLFIITISLLTHFLFIPISKINKAKRLINENDYYSAIKILEKLDGFSDADIYITISQAHISFRKGDYISGIRYLETLGEVTILYYVNNNEVQSSSYSGYTISAEIASKLSFTKKSPVLDGYYFDGWVLKDYDIQKSRKNVSSEVQLEAIMVPVEYTITYHLNGGTGKQTEEYDIESRKLTLYTPSRTGYNFLGWFDNEALTGTPISEIPTGSYGDKELYANWRKYYIINYIVEDEETIIIREPFKVYYKDILKLDNNNYEIENYVFSHWDIILNDVVINSFAENTEFEIPILNGIDIIIKAAFFQEEELYSISYISEYGGGTGPKTKKVYSNVKIQIETNTYEYLHYHFIGWYYDGVIYEEFMIFNQPEENVVFKAMWEEMEQTEITFNGNGGLGDYPETILIYEDETFVLPESYFTKDHHDFEGWTIDGIDYSPGETIYYRANEILVVAKWKEHPKYTLSYNFSGGIGEAKTPIQAYAGETIRLDSYVFYDFYKEYHTFVSWTYNGTSYSPGSNFIMPESDVVIYAKWQENQKYRVSFQYPSNGVQTIDQYYYGGQVFYLPSYGPYGYWLIDNKFYAQGTLYTMPYRNISFWNTHNPNSGGAAN